MLIWSGWGFLAFLIPFFILIATEIISESITGDTSYYQTHPALMLIGLVISAITLFIIEKYSHKKKGKNTLFFIEIKYWPIILIIIGLVVLMYNRV